MPSNPERTIAATTLVPAPPEAVWELVSEPDRFAEWAELETECPTKVVTADMGRNLKYIRGLMAARKG